MEGLFLQVLNMSISASWLILAVLILRLILQQAKVPKNICYILWFFVAVRLLCPISLESGLSLIPSGQTFSEEKMYGENPRIDSGIESVDSVVNNALSQLVVVEGTVNSGTMDIVENDEALQQNDSNLGNQVSDNENLNASPENENEVENSHTLEGGNTTSANGNTNNTGHLNHIGNINNTDDVDSIGETSANPLQNLIGITSVLWGIGIIGMLVYTLISYIRLQNRVRIAIHLRDNLWICDEIRSPFILGLLNPRIYLPSHIEEEQIPYIIAHEKEHLKYRDNWWKPLGFGILAIHWFNPLVWMAYVLMCRDIELACDERVIRTMDTVEKRKYSESLLICSSPRHLISACPVAFGEVGIKERIKSVVNYRKPATWIVGIGALLCVIVAICFLTNPKESTIFEEWTSSITAEDIYWVEVSKNYGHETVSCRISKDKYEELCAVFQTIKDEDCSTRNEIGDGLDSYELIISRDDKIWNFFCFQDGTVGLLFEDYETGAYYGCEGEILVIESPELWNYIRSVVEEDGKLELTPTKAVDYLFDENFAKLTVYSSYYEMERACMITRDSNVILRLPSFFYNYEWEWVENPNISSTDTWVRLESKSGTAEMVFWDIGDGLIECTLPSGQEEVTLYWQGTKKASVESEISFFENAFRMCLATCTSDEYNKTHNAESLLKLVELVGLEELYADYDGEEICHYFVDNSVGMMQRDDLVYYCTDETDIQEVIQVMFSVMLDPLLEPSENRPFTVTEYRLDEMEVIQGSENVWFIPYVQGYYKYDGVDLVTFEEQLSYTEADKDGLIPFFGQGSDSMFYYILIKNGDVYRLERGGRFTEKYDYLLLYNEQLEAAEYTESVLYEAQADLTHDGVLDKVQLIMYLSNDAGDFGSAVANLRSIYNYTRVKVYEGYGYSDYSQEPIYTSEKFGVAAENKGTIGLTDWMGEKYLFIAHMNEVDENADYSYSLFYLENGQENIIESDEIQFSMQDNPYAWVAEGQEFQTNLSQKVQEGIVLAGFDSEVTVCEGRVKKYANNYFNVFWNPGNEVISQLMMERLRKLGLETPNGPSLETEFIASIDEQMANYFQQRENTYTTNDTETERGRAFAAWEERLRLSVEEAEIGYVYDNVYTASETEKVVLVYEVGFMEAYYPNEDERGTLFVNTEHLFTFQLENGQWNLVSDAYIEPHLGYQQGLDLADWEVYLHGTLDGSLDLESLYELQNTDLSVWFEDYNGETIQCIRGAEASSPAIREDIVYYCTDETDVQVILKRMIEEMMNPLMEESEERPYTITQYRIDDSEVYQVNENIWYVTYLNGYYKYEGMDMATFEGRLEYESTDEDGLLPFERQGTEGVFSYVLLKEGNVYCLRRFGSMDF